MAAKHIKLEDDVARMVATMAKRNSRSTAREVSHALREHYTTPSYAVQGLAPGDNMPAKYSTVLDSTPRTHEGNRLRMRG